MSKAAAAAAAAAEAAAVTAAAEAAAAAAAAADVHTDIKAHSLVLRTLSPYVDGALSGEWAEAAERLIELTVDSEQELDDLRLLIKRCYTDSYAFDDGKLLPFDTRVRLAVRADALEFVGAVNQLVESLSLGLDFEQAVACLETLPPAVEQHAGISAVRNRAVQVLNNHLGPVVGMFEEAGELMNGTMPLRDVVKQLSPAGFKRLLASEALQLQSENEAYALLCAWLHLSPHVTDGAQRLAFFMELAPLMRYHHMTPDFVAITVCRCPLMQKTDLLPSVMTAAFVQREAPPAVVEERQVSLGGANRGVARSAAAWRLKTSFTLEEVAALESGAEIERLWAGGGLSSGSGSGAADA